MVFPLVGSGTSTWMHLRHLCQAGLSSASQRSELPLPGVLTSASQTTSPEAQSGAKSLGRGGRRRCVGPLVVSVSNKVCYNGSDVFCLYMSAKGLRS